MVKPTMQEKGRLLRILGVTFGHTRTRCMNAGIDRQSKARGERAASASGLVRALGPIDAIVIGSMIGSGIFIVSAESSRLSGAPGWLLLAWAIAGLMTITGALCCSELATMMPRAGGVYVFLREAFGPSIGFLYGWTLFLVIQTGTIAAVAV